MSTDQTAQPAAVQPAPVAPVVNVAGATWGNSGPLCLAGFATTTFMLSMINANLVPAAILPAVFGVALMFGGLAQFVGGIIQLRIGNVFGGVLFCGFGAFWMSLWAFAEFFLRAVPLLQVGRAQGLFLYAFGIFAAIMFLASFRTSVAVVTALLLLVAALFLLAPGFYNGTTGLVKAGGWVGIALAGFAFYICLAELCDVTYGKELLPVGHLAPAPEKESLGE